MVSSFIVDYSKTGAGKYEEKKIRKKFKKNKKKHCLKSKGCLLPGGTDYSAVMTLDFYFKDLY